MKNNKPTATILILIVVLLSAYFFMYQKQKSGEKTFTFECANSRTIVATFYLPQDYFVHLTLSDGRILKVPHAVSASGARYANTDESFVFWNKGNTAFITEGTSSTETFSDCIIKP